MACSLFSILIVPFLSVSGCPCTMPALAPPAPSIPGEALQVEDLRARDVAPARAPAIASDPVTGRLWERKASGNSTDLSREFPSVEVERPLATCIRVSIFQHPPPPRGRGSLNLDFFFFQNEPRQPHLQVSCQLPSTPPPCPCLLAHPTRLRKHTCCPSPHAGTSSHSDAAWTECEPPLCGHQALPGANEAALRP